MESTVSDRVLTFKAADVHATSPFHMETRVDADPGFSESVRIEARVKLSACGNATVQV